MNNYDWIKSHTLEEVGHFLCDKQYDANDTCDSCPYADDCYHFGLESRNGYINFLEAEHED